MCSFGTMSRSGRTLLLQYSSSSTPRCRRRAAEPRRPTLTALSTASTQGRRRECSFAAILRRPRPRGNAMSHYCDYLSHLANDQALHRQRISPAVSVDESWAARRRDGEAPSPRSRCRPSPSSHRHVGRGATTFRRTWPNVGPSSEAVNYVCSQCSTSRHAPARASAGKRYCPTTPPPSTYSAGWAFFRVDAHAQKSSSARRP